MYVHIVPIHKSSKKLSVSNYRPISLLPQIAKVFEKILCEQILSHVRPAISEQQHGFVSGRDCSTNLASFLQEAYRAVDQRDQLDVAYTNFSKTFDRVNHDFLLYKLKSYNINPNILMLLQSYLTDRRQSYCGWFYLHMENSALGYSTGFNTRASPIFIIC